MVPFWCAADAGPTLRAPFLSPEALDRLVRRRASWMIRAAGKTAFYRARLAAVGVDLRDPRIGRDPWSVLAALAPVGKAELRQAGTAVLRGGRARRRWYSSTSSGSTGEPFRVYYDERAWATLKYLVKIRSRLACGLRPTDRVAVLDAVPAGATRMPIERSGRVRRISVLQPGADVAAAMIAFAPDVVYGLPSALLEAGSALRSRGAPLGIRAVFTGGELLPDSIRAALAGAFGAPVFDVYGTSETKEIAWECPQGGMHVNADVVHLEVLDDAGEGVPDGVEGELVASVLVNRAMPLLRYRLGDRGRLRMRGCACGRALPLLGVVTGREADTLVLAGGRRISPYALTCALEQVGELLRYQVTQLGASRLQVRAILEPSASRAVAATRVRHALRENVASFLEADVEFVDRLPTGPGGLDRGRCLVDSRRGRTVS